MKAALNARVTANAKPLAHAPHYWPFETTGVLAPAVLAYLHDELMCEAHIAALRAYLRQWIDSPVWHGEAIEALRAGIERLTHRAAFDEWLDRALELGIDPL